MKQKRVKVIDAGLTLYSHHHPWKFCHATGIIFAERIAGDCQRVSCYVGTEAYGCLLGELASHTSVTYKHIEQYYKTINLQA
jgi:hypothetical protein